MSDSPVHFTKNYIEGKEPLINIDNSNKST